jgi:predicted  nucleic acid-binding Zn-ribbon protein
MTSQAEALYALQKIDMTLQKSRKRLTEIEGLLANDAQVKQAKLKVESATTRLTPLRTKVRDLELEMQTAQQKHKTSEDRLYSGLVKNPKELQDLQNEITSLVSRIKALEDHVLEVMMLVEDATDQLTIAETKLQNALNASAKQNSELVAEQNQLLKSVEALNLQRAKALESVTPDSLKTYESLRPKKANQPVAVMRNCSCTLCGIEETKFIEEAVRKGNALVLCVGCGRILIEMA